MTTESALVAVVHRLRRDTADRNPVSREQHERARAVLPGGSTRTILHHAPFPLTFVEGHEGTLTDADGHRYVDLVGDYTAGLLGHSEKRVHAAVADALANNTSVGGVHPAEIRFAELVCNRFGHQRVRFTNSGTEANLFAITLSRIVTGRSTIMVMHGGYHGGVFYYSHGNAPWNAPFPTIIAPYNDLETCEQLIDDYRSDLAAVIVEPMLGSGCVPAEPRFLGGLANAAQRAGAIFITDEVMTSRHGPRGLADLLGVRPDIATFGKYFAGGFSFGAFAGRAELLDRFDASKPDSIPHAGTFNNNVATMSAGCVVLGELFTSDTAVGPHGSRRGSACAHRRRAASTQAAAQHHRIRLDERRSRSGTPTAQRHRSVGARSGPARSALPVAAATRRVHGAARQLEPRPGGHRQRPRPLPRLRSTTRSASSPTSCRSGRRDGDPRRSPAARTW